MGFCTALLGINSTQCMQRILCWSPLWSKGFEHLGREHVVVAKETADSALLAFTEEGVPFRLAYSLRWDARGHLLEAKLNALLGSETRHLWLKSDGEGHWRRDDWEDLPALSGCIDIDIWPTPLTNSFPIWRSQLRIGERREFLMAWVSAPELTVKAKPQAYTRLQEHLYLFESLDGSAFRAELTVDEEGFVINYPDLFCRVPVDALHVGAPPTSARN